MSLNLPSNGYKERSTDAYVVTGIACIIFGVPYLYEQ